MHFTNTIVSYFHVSSGSHKTGSSAVRARRRKTSCSGAPFHFGDLNSVRKPTTVETFADCILSVNSVLSASFIFRSRAPIRTTDHNVSGARASCGGHRIRSHLSTWKRRSHRLEPSARRRLGPHSEPQSTYCFAVIALNSYTYTSTYVSQEYTV